MADNPAFDENKDDTNTTSFTSAPAPEAAKETERTDEYETINVEENQSNPTASSETSEIPAPYAGK